MRSAIWILMASCTVGCASNTGTGFLAGVTVGASAGGLIGGGSGALIATFAGGVAGSLIGVALDEQDRKVMQKNSPRTIERMEKAEPLTLNDVIKLSQGGISDDAILRYMIQTQSTYELSQPQKRRLLDSGVSIRVINFMVDRKQT